jgi:prepilin peptidase CpaA
VIVPVLVLAAAAAASIVDIRTRRVPNALTLAIATTGTAVAAAGYGRVGIVAALVGGLVGVLVMLPGHLVGQTGAGDVKLLGALGTLLGPGDTMMAFLYSAIAGGVLALMVAAHRGRLAATIGATGRLVATGGRHAVVVEDTTRNNRFAYAPAVALGAVLAGF